METTQPTNSVISTTVSADTTATTAISTTTTTMVTPTSTPFSNTIYRFGGGINGDKENLEKIKIACPPITGLLRLSERRRLPNTVWMPVNAQLMSMAAKAMREEDCMKAIFHEREGKIVIAGGAVVSAMRQLHHSATYHLFDKSDVDIFMLNCSSEDCRKIVDGLVHDLNPRWITRSSFSFTFHHPTIASTSSGRRHYHLSVQLVLHDNKDLPELLNDFDIDCCAVAFDGTNIAMMERAARALTRGCNIVSLHRQTSSLDKRLVKYYKRGFDIAFPRSELENWTDIDEMLLSTHQGISYLLFPGYDEWCHSINAKELSKWEKLAKGEGNLCGYDADAHDGCETFVAQIFHLAERVKYNDVVHNVIGLPGNIKQLWDGIQPTMNELMSREEANKWIAKSGPMSEEVDIRLSSDALVERIDKYCKLKRELSLPMSLSRVQMNELGAKGISPIRKFNWYCKKGVVNEEITNWIKDHQPFLQVTSGLQHTLESISAGVPYSVYLPVQYLDPTDHDYIPSTNIDEKTLPPRLSTSFANTSRIHTLSKLASDLPRGSRHQVVSMLATYPPIPATQEEAIESRKYIEKCRQEAVPHFKAVTEVLEQGKLFPPTLTSASELILPSEKAIRRSLTAEARMARVNAQREKKIKQSEERRKAHERRIATKSQIKTNLPLIGENRLSLPTISGSRGGSRGGSGGGSESRLKEMEERCSKFEEATNKLTSVVETLGSRVSSLPSSSSSTDKASPDGLRSMDDRKDPTYHPFHYTTPSSMEEKALKIDKTPGEELAHHNKGGRGPSALYHELIESANTTVTIVSTKPISWQTMEEIRSALSDHDSE